MVNWLRISSVRKGFGQGFNKAVPVAIGVKDGPLSIAQGGQVIKRAVEFDAQDVGPW